MALYVVFRPIGFINTRFHPFSTLISRTVHHAVLKFCLGHSKPLPRAATCDSILSHTRRRLCIKLWDLSGATAATRAVRLKVEIHEIHLICEIHLHKYRNPRHAYEIHCLKIEIYEKKAI